MNWTPEIKEAVRKALADFHEKMPEGPTEIDIIVDAVEPFIYEEGYQAGLESGRAWYYSHDGLEPPWVDPQAP